MQKIALYGKATAGKTTLAEAFIDTVSYDGAAALYRFAGPLKDGLAVMGITKDGSPELYRKAAQFLGTEIVRDFDVNWWVKQMDERLKSEIEWADDLGELSYFIIDDLRFGNELAWCEMNGFLTVKIDVSPETQLARGMAKERMTHPSETALDHIPDMRWKLIIPENTTVEERVQLLLNAVEEAETYELEKLYT